MAMISGKIAGEVAAESIQSGSVSEKAMAAYESRLKDTFVLKDLHHYRRMSGFMEANPHLLNAYPKMLTQAAKMYLTVDGVPKKTRQKEIFRMVLAHRSKTGLIKDAYGAWRSLL